jgi:hypothetical protein
MDIWILAEKWGQMPHEIARLPARYIHAAGRAYSHLAKEEERARKKGQQEAKAKQRAGRKPPVPSRRRKD